MNSIDKTLNNIYEELTLEEGIVFLKNGKRIRNLIKKIRSKANDINNEELKAFIITLQRKARKFEEFELDFGTATKEEKKEIKIRYDKFVKRNKALVDKINSESFKKLLITLGIIGLFATIVAAVFGLGSLFIDKDDISADDLNKDGSISDDEKREVMKAKNYIQKVEYDKEKVYTKNEIQREKMHADTETQRIKTLEPVQVDTNHIELKKFIDEMAKEHGVPPKLVRSIIQQESEWDIDNISNNSNGSKDMGLMQLNSKYIDYYKNKFWTQGKEFDPLNPEDNATIGIKYLAHLIRYYKGNIDLAIQAYNCGPTAVDAGKIPAATVAYLARVKRGA